MDILHLQDSVKIQLRNQFTLNYQKLRDILCAESSFSQFAARKQGRTYAEWASL